MNQNKYKKFFSFSRLKKTSLKKFFLSEPSKALSDREFHEIRVIIGLGMTIILFVMGINLGNNYQQAYLKASFQNQMENQMDIAITDIREVRVTQNKSTQLQVTIENKLSIPVQKGGILQGAWGIKANQFDGRFSMEIPKMLPYSSITIPVEILHVKNPQIIKIIATHANLKDVNPEDNTAIYPEK